MTWKRYLRRAFSLPPQTVARKAVRVGWQVVQRQWSRQRDTHAVTYVAPSSIPPGDLHCYFKPVSTELLRPHAAQIAALSRLCLDHTFDLLGSGWVQVRHGMCCRGLENHRYDMGQSVEADAGGRWLIGRINPANLEESRRIWQMVDPGYVPIDWHLDFKSGYRWNEATWYQDIVYGHLPGVDVKVPWELTRMQHLPQLAWAYALATSREQGFAAQQTYLHEFRSEVLDFIATNPPCFGVNWRTPMDVAIRAANWLVAYDLFRAYGAAFDAPFEAELKRSLYQHGQHITANLEWYPEGRGNHYLADIVGLLFAAAYLPRTPEVDAWLAFAVQELAGEVEYQFNADGSNFEASTSYHRLSAEMAIYATALVLGLPPEKQDALRSYDHRLLGTRPALGPAPVSGYPLPEWYFERLEKAAEFTLHITKPSHRIPQIGDNDSGRFLKLQSAFHPITVPEAKARYANLEGYDGLPTDAIYWDDDILDHHHLVAAANGLFRRDHFADFTGVGWLETDLVRLLVGTPVPSYRQRGESAAAARVMIGTKEDWERLKSQQGAVADLQRHTLEAPVPGGDLRDGLALWAYPDFGLYIYRSKRLYLAIRCGTIGQYGNGGHAHNDQLSIELSIDSEDWITDPGTYLYTSLPGRRNEYRSIKAHFAPRPITGEPWSLDAGLFELQGETKAICECFCAEGFVGTLTTNEGGITRSIQIEADAIMIEDTASAPNMLAAQDQPQLDDRKQPSFSNGYGKLLSRLR